MLGGVVLLVVILLVICNAFFVTRTEASFLKDLAAAKENVNVAYLMSVGNAVKQQAFPLRLALLGPLEPRNTGSMIRLFPGTCYVAEPIAALQIQRRDNLWLDEVVAKARKEEE